jgi:hypothetical protein
MPSIKEAGKEDQKSIQSTRNSSKLRLLLTQQNQQKKENYRRLPSSSPASAMASASVEAGNEKAIQTKDNLEAIKRTVTAAIATAAASAEAADEVDCLLVVNRGTSILGEVRNV